MGAFGSRRLFARNLTPGSIVISSNPQSLDAAFRAAVENVSHHGDTDVFPYPIENHVFFDDPQAGIDLLLTIHRDLEAALKSTPPVTESMLSPAGYTGFRWATQIDPIWNAYFLGIIIKAGEQIEAARIPKERKTIFSYRFSWDDAAKTIFDRTIGWVEFQKHSVELARSVSHVLVCDISDFYPRIYHHRLENALHKATSNADECWRIITLLMSFSKGASYGLPVGGPAARLLSELLLNRVDRLLVANGVVFCRFADDYHIFAKSAEQAYRHLLFLSEKLSENEGLLLQKSKTRILSSEEFLATSEFAAENKPDAAGEVESREFLRLRLYFDPYSATAAEDYEALKKQLSKFDVIAMLGREIRKSRIHQTLSKRLIGALKHVDGSQRDAAIVSLIDNLPVLYPVFPSIIVLIKSLINDIGASTRERALACVRDLLRSGSYIAQVPTHLDYAVRLLAHDNSDEADEVLVKVYNESTSSAIRRDVILAMARKGADFWISDARKSFATVTPWERTALMVSSYTLGDEGRHWRRTLGGSLTPMQEITKTWASTKVGSSSKWEIPI